MPAPVTFREAAPVDLETLLSLIHAYYRHDAIPFDKVALRPVLARFLNDPTLGLA